MKPNRRWSLRRIRKWFSKAIEATPLQAKKAQLEEALIQVESDSSQDRLIKKIRQRQQHACTLGTKEYRRYQRYYLKMRRLLDRYKRGSKGDFRKVSLCMSEIARAAEMLHPSV